MRSDLNKKKNVIKDYTLVGEPMTIDEYTERIKNARKGKSITHVDFLKEVKKW